MYIYIYTHIQVYIYTQKSAPERERERTASIAMECFVLGVCLSSELGTCKAVKARFELGTYKTVKDELGTCKTVKAGTRHIGDSQGQSGRESGRTESIAMECLVSGLGASSEVGKYKTVKIYWAVKTFKPVNI